MSHCIHSRQNSLKKQPTPCASPQKQDKMKNPNFASAVELRSALKTTTQNRSPQPQQILINNGTKVSSGDSSNSSRKLNNVSPKKPLDQQQNQIDNQFSLININQVHTYTLGRCGYCQNTKWMTSGFDCAQMALKDYQTLMDRGWRRCGTYYYKPHVDFCCCRTFPIRVAACNFKQNSSQKKVMRKFDKMLETPAERIPSSTPLISATGQNNGATNNEDENEEDDDNEDDNEDDNDEDKDFLFQSKETSRSQSLHPANSLILDDQSRKNQSIQEGSKEDQSKFPPPLSLDDEFVYEIERIWKIVLPFCAENIIENISQILEATEAVGRETDLIKMDTIMEESKLYKNKNMIKYGSHSSNFLIIFYSKNIDVWGTAFKTRDRFFAATYQIFKESIKKTNERLIAEHKDLLLKISQAGDINILNQKRSFLKRLSRMSLNKKSALQGGTNNSLLSPTQQSLSFSQSSSGVRKKRIVVPEIRRNFEKKLFRAEFDEESYKLYRRYNEVIHNNMKTSKESYKNFLCVNGLRTSSTHNGKGKVLEYGCFHFRYYVDDVLIAVSVVDILPQGLSSVYYFYEPDLKKYSLGVTGNIRDIEYIKEMQLYFPDFKHYYLGYYIHGNNKMSYKAQYKPFELLCPITYRWVAFDKVAQDSFCQEEKIPRLAPLTESIIEDMDFSTVDIEKYVMQKVKLYISGRYIKISQIKQSFSTYFQYLLQKLVTLLGKQLSESLVFGQQ